MYKIACGVKRKMTMCPLVKDSDSTGRALPGQSRGCLVKKECAEPYSAPEPVLANDGSTIFHYYGIGTTKQNSEATATSNIWKILTAMPAFKKHVQQTCSAPCASF